MGLLAYLRYVQLKLIVSLLRLQHRLFGRARTVPRPDARLDIPSRDAGRTIRVHVYEPSSSGEGPQPVLFNQHGSGFVMPLHGEDDVYCRHVARHTPFSVFDIRYRLAPEHPFPAALHDVEDVVAWVRARPDQYAAERLAIGGFSAGANLALAAASSSTSLGVVPPLGEGLPGKDTFRAVVAVYPPADLAGDARLKSPPDPSGGRMPPWLSRVFDGSYFAGAGLDPRDPRISPFYAPADAFPRAVMVVTPDQDYLCDEGEALARRIEEEGGDEGRYVRSLRVVGCGHAFDKGPAPGSLAERRRDEVYEAVVEFLMR